MADHALDAESVRRDRERYQGFLVQAERELANCTERIEQLHQAIDALDRLLALTAEGPVPGVAPARPAPDGLAGPAQGAGPSRGASEGDAGVGGPAPRRRAASTSRRRSAAATPAPSPTATPAAPEPVEPPGASAASPAPAPTPTAAAPPKGTDALRLVLESDRTRTWSLGELLDALGARGWLPASRRPEEGVRISLKRLVERGGAERAADGRWRHPSGDGAAPNGSAQAAEAGRLRVAPPRDADEPPAAPAARQPAPPPRRAASFGLPVGGTVTEL